MEVFGIPLAVLIAGLLGYIWKLRRDIVKIIPGQTDDKVLDVIEGIMETYELDADQLAKKSRGKLKAEVRKELNKKKE